MADDDTYRVRIPTIGEVLTIARGWTFTAYSEHRNKALMDYLERTGAIPAGAPRWEPPLCGADMVREYEHRPWPYVPGSQPERRTQNVRCRLALGHDGACRWDAPVAQQPARWGCTLPRGTRLRVDRIYIRKGAADYDSLTFWAQNLEAKKKVRFWAKLTDVNLIVAADGPLGDDAPLPPVRAILLRE